MQTDGDLLPFRYQQLNEARREIRLVTLHAPPQEGYLGTVECSIQTVSLNMAVRYFAVSYVWGASFPTQKLIIKGEGPEEPQTLDIGMNLDEALRKFRDEEHMEECYLWIDAICINQSDNDEKAWQVASMKSIYEQAVLVLAWLGPSVDSDKKAFDMLESLENRIHDTGPDLSEERFKEFEDSLAKDDGSGGRAIQKIIERPWFQRIWIQQEFLAAREVTFVCGKYSCIWEALFIASSTIKSLQRVTWAKVVGQVLTLEEAESALFGLHTAGYGTDIFRMRCDFQSNRDIYSLWDLLLAAKADEIQSTDPRDTIYALLSLARDSRTLGINVDYELTAQMCFIVASKALLLQGHLRLLWLSSHFKIMEDLPSWVPDWSAKLELNSYIIAYCKREIRWDLPGSDDGHFSAGGSSPPDISFKTVDSRELLIIRGLFYDQISATSDILGNWKNYNPFEYLLLVNELIKNMASGCIPPLNLAPEVIVRTLLHDTEYIYDDHNSFTPVENINVSWRLGPELLAEFTNYILKGNMNPDANLGKLYSFLEIRMSALENRLIFITANGSLGIGAAQVKPGDRVTIFQGAETPFIIREDCVSCEVYNLMSEAYVHGIMYGELMQGEPDTRYFQIY